jgi:hypothetical protein
MMARPYVPRLAWTNASFYSILVENSEFQASSFHRINNLGLPEIFVEWKGLKNSPLVEEQRTN